MKIHKILVLLTAVILLLTSCSNKPVNSNNLNDNPETEVIQLAPDYTVKKVETDFDIISGISNGEIYGIDYSTYYSVYYSNLESPEQSFFFPSDLSGIFYLKELNDKVYIYGYNQEDQYKIYIFSSDMKEHSEILFDDKHITSIAPLSDGRIFISGLDGYKNFLRIYSPEGEILNTVYPECMNVGNSLWINDSTVTDDDTIVISVEENYSIRTLSFDSNLEYIGDIQSDIEYSDNIRFSQSNGSVYLCNTNYENHTADIYRVISAFSPLEYITSITSVQSTISGAGDYDFEYIKNDDLYGFRLSDDSSEKICENTSPEHIFYSSDSLNCVFSANKHSQKLVKKGSSGNDAVYDFIDADLFNFERISYENHFQALKYEDRQYSVCDISMSGQGTKEIPLDLDDSDYINDLLVSNSNIYVYLIDENDCCNIKTFDKNGKEVFVYESENRIADFSVMNDGGLFLIEEDEAEEEYIYSVFVAGKSEPVRIEMSEQFADESPAACFPSYTDNTVYLMSEGYIYSASIDNNTCNLSVLVSLEKIQQSLESGIYNFFCDNDNLYIVSGNEIYQLTVKDEVSELQNKQETEETLNIAYINCMPDEWVKEKFEENHPGFRMNNIIYDSSAEDFTESFNLSILNDKALDIIVMRDEGISDYSITRDNNKGAYVDLYSLISDDDELDVMDFRSNVLEAMEYQGRLFQISPYFTVRTVLGREKNIRGAENWTVGKFADYLSSHPDTAFFRNDREIVSGTALNLMPFYNYHTNKCSFDSDEFRSLIETVQQFPEQAEMISEFDLLDVELYNYNQINEVENVYFKDKVINAGLPGVEGNGAVIIPDIQFSVMENSKKYKESWDFIKYYLSEDYFDRNYTEIQGFPIINSLSAKLEKITENITEDGDYLTLNAYDFMKNQVKIAPPDENYILAVNEILNNASVVKRYDFRIDSIFTDEYIEYIDGGQSITDMSKNIQKKVEIYLGERD